MARYIEREKFLKKCAEAWGYAGVTIKAIEQIANECTTADVVPKSEVEELNRECESLGKTVNQASELIRKLKGKVEKAKTDVAREIFEEIKICLEYEYMSYLKAYDYTLLTRIEDLENKYIGGET